MNTPTAAKKFTRRHITARVMTDVLDAMTAAAGDLAHGEKFACYCPDGGYAWIKLEGCDTHGPVRCGLADDPSDFEACRRADAVLRAGLAAFGNLSIDNQGRAFLLDFSGTARSQSVMENRD